MAEIPTLFDTHRHSLHLLELDSLVGPQPTAAGFQARLSSYLEQTEWEPDDHVVVRADPGLLGDDAVELECGWRAQSAPLHDLHPRLVAGRHDRLVIAASDDAFADLAGAVSALGTPVWVVTSDPDECPELCRRADHVVRLPRSGRARPRRSA